MAPAAPDHDDDTRQLLVGRLRTGLWLILVGIVAFALSDPVMHPDLFRQLYAVVGVELVVVLGAIWLVGFAASRAQVIAIALTVASALCVTTALSGNIVGDAATTPVLLLVFTLGAATLLPWDRPQLALQVVATAAILWNVHVVRGHRGGPRRASLGVAERPAGRDLPRRAAAAARCARRRGVSQTRRRWVAEPVRSMRAPRKLPHRRTAPEFTRWTTVAITSSSLSASSFTAVTSSSNVVCAFMIPASLSSSRPVIRKDGARLRRWVEPPGPPAKTQENGPSASPRQDRTGRDVSRRR